MVLNLMAGRWSVLYIVFEFQFYSYDVMHGTSHAKIQFFPANITVISYLSQFWASLIAEEDEQFGAYFQLSWRFFGNFGDLFGYRNP